MSRGVVIAGMPRIQSTIMRTHGLTRCAMCCLLVLIAAGGCAIVPPGRIVSDRLDYGQVIAESWKRQTLLNVVRLRYADAPVFLDVSSVINSYSMMSKATGSLELPSRADPKVFDLGAERSFSNTPTVTYQPLLGDRFTRSLLQPVQPASVFQLLQAGWPAEVVLGTVVGSINRLHNAMLGVPADAGFLQLVESMSRIQKAGNLGIRVEAHKDGSAIVLVMRQRDAQQTADTHRIRDLLELDDASSEFSVVYGQVSRNGREVAVLSRSMLEIMLNLGFGIDVPAAHVTDGLTSLGRLVPGEPEAEPIVHIRSGTSEPPSSYTAVPYKDHWFWIDDNDAASKRTFTFLLILFSLAETGQGVAAPVVTVPSR